MSMNQNLTWTDVKSPTLSPDIYLEKFARKVNENYESYEPKNQVLNKISKLLAEKEETLKIVALGADWCPDCTRNMPRMIKIIKSIDSKKIEFRILYGIVVNALHKPGEIIWHKKRSPPEAVNPKFDLQAIPTFYFFNKTGKILDIISEKPKVNSTLEEDLLEILENKL